VSGSYVDSRLRTREADLLFQVQLAGSPVLIYLLFEHQSHADPRLLCRPERRWQAVCLVLEYCLKVDRDVTEQDLQVLFADSDLPEAQEAIMTLAEKWLQQGWEKGREEGWEKGRQEGRQEGREEGREEGRQEGRQEGQRLLLVRQLRLRFRRLPRAVVARIEAAGPAELERWSERILTARTLAEVMAD